jgi:fermentation-respiration switch protein FrsA (DUF1100 family)
MAPRRASASALSRSLATTKAAGRGFGARSASGAGQEPGMKPVLGYALKKAVLGLCLLSLSGCSRFLYYPTHELYYDPARFGLEPEEVRFASPEGPRLYGWYFQGEQPAKATVVQFHGNGENLSSHYASLAWIVKHPYNLFIFDYQGYGRSEGSPSPENTVKDGIAALEWAHRKDPKLPLVVVGQSLGGAVALKAVIDGKDHLPIRFVAVDSTFPSYKGMAREVLSRSWLTWPFQWLGLLLFSDRYAPEGEIGKISPIPLLVIHGDKDQTVELEMGKKVFAEAREPKEFWEIHGGGHTDVFTIQPDSYKEKFLERMSAALKGKNP